ncbi:MAG: hypothetical protein IT427_13315 [Pirellulales bacterium]|nr:hypothetical protein [Pirellulales bacterium]
MPISTDRETSSGGILPLRLRRIYGLHGVLFRQSPRFGLFLHLAEKSVCPLFLVATEFRNEFQPL